MSNIVNIFNKKSVNPISDHFQWCSEIAANESIENFVDSYSDYNSFHNLPSYAKDELKVLIMLNSKIWKQLKLTLSTSVGDIDLTSELLEDMSCGSFCDNAMGDVLEAYLLRKLSDKFDLDKTADIVYEIARENMPNPFCELVFDSALAWEA